MDLISVIIPVYNAGKYLRPCLDSVTGQTYSNLQIILINDGSVDNSLEICREYAEKDPRILLIDQKNSGVSAARNRGIAEAKGDWFSFIDSDDYLELDAYEYLMGIAEEHCCDALLFEYYVTYKDHETPHKSFAWRYGLSDRNKIMQTQCECSPFTCTKLFSRKLVDGLIFDETIARGEDGLFNTYALHKVKNAYFAPRPLYHYVQSEESAVRGSFRPSQLTALHLIDHYIPFFTEHYPQLLPSWTESMEHLLVSLYFDMYADASDYSNEMKTVKLRFSELYGMLDKKRLRMKNRIKFMLFRYFTKLYCCIHKKD